MPFSKSKHKNMKDICCIGHITLDKIITPKRTTYKPGGTSYYFSYAINNLPQKIDYQMVTSLGRSEMNTVAEMKAAGMDVIAYASKQSVYFENTYSDDLDDRSQRVLAQADPFTIEQVKDLDAKIFHLGSLLHDDFSSEVVEFLASKGDISIDVQGYLREVRRQKVYPIDWEEKAKVLRHTRILKMNEHEMSFLTKQTNVRDAAKAMASYGVKEVVITLGKNGSVIYAGGQFYEIPAYTPAEQVDSTGCGDTYCAGYLYCRSQGCGFVESGKYASAMCSLKLEHNGPFDHTEKDVLARIRQ